MLSEDYFEIGKVAKTHGYKGELNLFLNKGCEDLLKVKGLVFLTRNEKQVPFFIQSISVHANRAVVKLEDLDTEQQAVLWRGALVAIKTEDVPSDRLETLFSPAQLEGYQVKDADLGLLGKISGYYPMPGNELISMQYGQHEVLIPFHEHIVVKADHRKKILFTRLPAGLIDIYTQEDNQKPEDDEG